MNKRGPASGHSFTVLPSEADRFWGRVDRSGECWLWGGHVGVGGYGAFHLHRVRRGPIAAHRVAYTIANGRIPAGKVVMHSCDNPTCVNPAHLSVGSQRDNIRDMMGKGRKRTALGRRIPCTRCGASRAGSPAPRPLGRTANYALCDRCHASAEELLSSLTIHRSRVGAAIRALRVIPPSDFGDLAAIVGERRAQAFARYFGAYDHAHETFESIAASHGVSRERIRQIVERVQDLLLQEYAMDQSPMQKAA